MSFAFHAWRPHPWHGLAPGKEPPGLVNAYIEITPIDGIKYEVDKESGYLKVDRPQLTSSLLVAGARHARKVVAAAILDYAAEFKFTRSSAG